MRKLNLKNYQVEVMGKDGEKRSIPYMVKDALIEIMFQPSLKLRAKSLLEQNTLAKKILEAKDEILLEEAEYGKILMAIERVEGLTRNEVVLVERILGCPEIKVKENK